MKFCRRNIFFVHKILPVLYEFPFFSSRTIHVVPDLNDTDNHIDPELHDCPYHIVPDLYDTNNHVDPELQNCGTKTCIF